jgi:hypothetical protein
MVWFHLPPPGVADWVSLVFVGVAVGLLARVEATRARPQRAPLAAVVAVPVEATVVPRRP